MRLAEDGANELPRQARRSALRIIVEVLREPMLALLLIGGVAYPPYRAWSLNVGLRQKRTFARVLE